MATQPNSTGPRLLLDDEGIQLGRISSINFVGPGVTATRNGLIGTVTIPGGGTVTPVLETPTGTRPGTIFTLSAIPASAVVLVNLNGDWQAPAGSPGLNEYNLSGTTLTMGTTIISADTLFVFYLTTGGTATTPHLETPVGTRPGTIFTLSASPSGAVVLINLNGDWQAPVVATPGLNEYVISGSTLTMGTSVIAGDTFFAFFLT